MAAIKRNTKQHNEYEFKAKWTAGKIVALHNALTRYAPESAVAQDVLNEVERAIRDAKDDTLTIE